MLDLDFGFVLSGSKSSRSARGSSRSAKEIRFLIVFKVFMDI